MREYEQPGIRLIGKRIKTDEGRDVSVNLLEIDYSQVDQSRLNQWALWVNGEFVPMGEIDVPLLVRSGDWFQDIGINYRADWIPLDLNSVSDGIAVVRPSNFMYEFTLHDGMINRFKTGAKPFFSTKQPSVIKDMNTGTEYTFPLNESDVLTIFGPFETTTNFLWQKPLGYPY